MFWHVEMTEEGQPLPDLIVKILRGEVDPDHYKDLMHTVPAAYSTVVKDHWRNLDPADKDVLKEWVSTPIYFY